MKLFTLDEATVRSGCADLTWLDDHYDTQGLLSLFEEARSCGGLTGAEIGGAVVELVMYPQDDEDSAGLILAVRPAESVTWLPPQLQLASTIQDTNDLFDADEPVDERAAVAALAELVKQGNAMLPVLARLAGDHAVLTSC